MGKQNLRTQKPPQTQKQKPLNEYVKYSGLAFQMAALLLLGYWAGGKIDQWLGLHFPIFTVSLMVLFMVISLYSLIKSLPKG
jgi:predicted membrane channel-forming protein YqfA (hemolysin III family)